MELTLPIENPSLGFDPLTGETVELRFTVANRAENEFADFRIRGAHAVCKAILRLGAWSTNDLGAARAIVRRSVGVMTLVSLIPKAECATPEARFDAPRDPIHCERCGFVGPCVRYVDEEDVCTDVDACAYRFGISVRTEQSAHGIFRGTWWRTTEVFGAPEDFA